MPEKTVTRGKKSLVLKYVKAFAVSVLITAVLLVVSCFFLNKMKDPDKSAETISLCVLFVSSFICGSLSARMTGSGVIAGAVSGAALTLILTLISVSFFPKNYEIGKSLVLHAAVIALAVLGSLVFRKKRNKRKYGKKYMKKHR